MKRAAIVLVLASGLVVLGPLSCSGVTFRNLTKEKTGNVSVVFINTTNARAAFSFGSYDAWDRSPGPVTLQQARVDAFTTNAPVSILCRRNIAVAGADFVKRVIDARADENLATFDPNLFDEVVHFSSAPSGDEPAASLPTAGTALGREVLLGIDFSCGDQLIFKFVEDPDAPGGFRVDFEVIRDKDPLE